MLCLPLQGLGYLHSKGKMHRDIKVQLLFISFSLNVNFFLLIMAVLIGHIEKPTV